MSLDQPPTPYERDRALRRLADVRHKARRRRRTRIAGLAGAAAVVAAFAVAIPTVFAASPGRQTVNVVGQPSTTTDAAPTTPTSTTSPPTTSETTAAPSTSTVTAAPTGPAPVVLPVSVQTDNQMRAAGNDGPSSSILAPTSCVLRGESVTATGGYTNGGFAPNVYNRYGDVVMLYVYTAPSPGYPHGLQVAQQSVQKSPPIGGYGTWRITEAVDPSLGQPNDCVVAAQPTHNVQLAP